MHLRAIYIFIFRCLHPMIWIYGQQMVKQKCNITKNDHSCKVCGKFFSSKSKLIIHEMIHTGEKSYKCHVCEKTFSYMHVLAKHTCEEPYDCVVCKKAFTTSSSLMEHKRLHTGEKPYESEICNKAFYSNSDWTKQTRVHTGEKPYSCTWGRYVIKHFHKVLVYPKVLLILKLWKVRIQIFPLLSLVF